MPEDRTAPFEATPAATPALAPLALPCPFCGEQEAGISLRLNCLDDEVFQCQECEAMFSVETVRAWAERWQRVLTWLYTVPQD